MWHKPCRTFHPWCPCIKTRCLWPYLRRLQCRYTCTYIRITCCDKEVSMHTCIHIRIIYIQHISYSAANERCCMTMPCEPLATSDATNTSSWCTVGCPRPLSPCPSTPLSSSYQLEITGVKWVLDCIGPSSLRGTPSCCVMYHCGCIT